MEANSPTRRPCTKLMVVAPMHHEGPIARLAATLGHELKVAPPPYGRKAPVLSTFALPQQILHKTAMGLPSHKPRSSAMRMAEVAWRIQLGDLPSNPKRVR